MPNKTFYRNKLFPISIIISLLLLLLPVQPIIVEAVDSVVITNPNNEFVQNNMLDIILQTDPNETTVYDIHMEKMEPSQSTYTALPVTTVTSTNNTLHYNIPSNIPSNTKFRYRVRAQKNDGTWTPYSPVKNFTYVNVTSASISVYPQPSTSWANSSVDVNVFFEGEPELLVGSTKYYKVTNSSAFPTSFTSILPSSGIVNLNNNGENYIHIKFVMSFGAVVTKTVGPYKIDLSPINNFTVSLRDTNGTAVNDWTNKTLNLSISLPSYAGASNLKRQYKIENYHSNWVDYNGSVQIDMEGEYRVFGRLVNDAGTVSEEKYVLARIDKTKPTYNSLTITESKNSSNATIYSVNTITANDSSGIDRVRLSTGYNLTKNGPTSEYILTDLTTRPTYIQIYDKAGNVSDNIAFLDIPTVTFANGYSITQPISKVPVKATMNGSGNLNYQFGNRTYSCATTPCITTIENNTEFTVLNENGKRLAKKITTINNIDTDPVRLVLNAERNASSADKIAFSWNYNAADSQIVCLSSTGMEMLSPGSGLSYTFSGAKNFTYNCTLYGTIFGNYEISNTITVYPDYNKEVDVPEGGNLTETLLQENVNIQYEESLLGDTYLINTNKNNLTNKKIPLPADVFSN